eukprot:5554-Heterococcus_DN1.PRE.4
MSACTEGRLSEVDVSFSDKSAATVVLAAAGYPEAYPKGMPIEGIAAANAIDGVTVYHAGTKLDSGVVKANGGRVLAVTGVGSDLTAAMTAAYKGVEAITFTPSHYRKDIGYRAKQAPLRIGVLASGGGTALQPVLDAIAAGELNARVELIITNKVRKHTCKTNLLYIQRYFIAVTHLLPSLSERTFEVLMYCAITEGPADAPVLARAAKAGVPARYIAVAGRTKDVYDDDVTAAFTDAGVSLVLLVGYMRILSSQFCTTWASRCLNVHPSLLPDFAGGMDMAVHEAVIAAKKEKSGCTIHFVTEVRLQQVFNKVMEGDLQHPEGFALRKL